MKYYKSTETRATQLVWFALEDKVMCMNIYDREPFVSSFIKEQFEDFIKRGALVETDINDVKVFEDE